MSYAIDVNVLLYASDSGSKLHDRARTFLQESIEDAELLYVPWPVAMGYLRIATHPSIFAHPLSPTEAISNLEALLRRPNVRTVAEGDGFWDAYRRVNDEVVVRGNLVPDAHLASLLIQNGVTELWTHDRDFRKFPGLRVRDPFEEPLRGKG